MNDKQACPGVKLIQITVSRILNLNIGGLAAKLVSNDFIDYLNTFDLICLTETFVDEGFEITALKEFIIFIAPANKLSRQGRRSGE